MPRKPSRPTPKPAPVFEPRQLEPGTEIAYTARDGSQRVLVADAAGSITPETAQDADVIDGFTKPVTGEEG